MDFPRMQPLTWRRLTPGEQDLARDVFGQGLDARRVRLFALPAWNRPFVPSGALVVWPAWIAAADFSAPGVPVSLTSILVHELTHVWQAQKGINLLFAKLRAGDGPKAYSYDLTGCCEFSALNIEQQAMVVQDDFLAARGESAPYEPQAYAAIRAAWTGGLDERPRNV